jgi:hypothetical protein
MYLLPTVLLAAAALGLSAGCVSEQGGPRGRVEVTSDPPPVPPETISSSPGLEYVWIGGAWVWSDHWVWEPGRWAHPPRAGAIWVPSRFVVHDGKRIFIQGGWQ